MIFDNLAVGDKVLGVKSVVLSWGNTIRFFIPVSVIRVTPKQFRIEEVGINFRRADGKQIGGHYSDICKPYTEIGDQSVEYEATITRVKQLGEIKRLCDQIKIGTNTDNNDLDKILLSLRNIKGML